MPVVEGTTLDRRRRAAGIAAKSRAIPTEPLGPFRLSLLGPGNLGPLGSLFRNAGREVSDIALGIPQAGFNLVSSVEQEIRHRPYELLNPLGLTGVIAKKALLEPQARYFQEKYGPLLPGGRPAGETLEAIKKSPVSTALDVLALGSVGAGTALRTIKFSKMLKSRQLGSEVQALTKQHLQNEISSREGAISELHAAIKRVGEIGFVRKNATGPHDELVYWLRTRYPHYDDIDIDEKIATLSRGDERLTEDLRETAMSWEPTTEEIASAESLRADRDYMIAGSQRLKREVRELRSQLRNIDKHPAAFNLVQSYRESKRLHANELRSLTYRHATVRPDTSPAPLTRYTQHLFDRFSEWLAEKEVGGMLSAGSRVAKRGSAEIRQDIRRTRAARAQDIRTISSIGGKPESFGVVRGRPARTAFFWEAQMPGGYRGGEGLRYLIADLRQLADKSEDFKEKARLWKMAARAEKSIGVPYNPAALFAAERLMNERRDIFIAAGKLAPETAYTRGELLAERLGLTGPSGEVERGLTGPIPIGHRRRGAPKAIRRLGQVRHAGGKTKTPPGIGQPNRLINYETGRLRTDPNVIIEDWQAAQHYDFLNRSKDFLASMGEPIEGRPNLGWFIVNRNGQKLPREWKDVDPDSATIASGFDPEDIIFQDIDEYARAIIAKTGTPEAANLLRNSSLEDVVQVPPDVVRHFFNSLVGPQGAGAGLSVLANGADAAGDMVRLSVLYTNPGFVPSNLVGNLGFATFHQGPFYLPGNLVRSAKVLVDPRSRDLRNRVLAEVGYGPTLGAASGGRNVVSRGVQGLARAESRVADDWTRVAAWFHEARKSGYRSGKDQLRLLSDESLRPELNAIRDRVHDGMVNFELLGPVEKAVATRILFVWPWIRGATHYATTFPLNYPIRSALISHAALDARRRKEDIGIQPSYLQGAFPIGPEDRAGYRQFINPNATSQFSTPLGLAQELSSVLSNRPTARTLGDILNPGLAAGAKTVFGLADYGTETRRVGIPRAAAQQFGELPSALRFAKELVSGGKSSTLYRPGRKEVLKRRVGRGFVPVDINLAVMHERAAREGVKQTGGPSAREIIVAELKDAEPGISLAQLNQVLREYYPELGQTNETEFKRADLAHLEVGARR